MKPVLVTIGQLNVGGAERRLLQLVQRLQAMQLPLRLTFFIVSGKAGAYDALFRQAGADLVYGHPGLRGLHDLWALCRKYRPEVLHINAETAAGFYAFAGLLAGVPVRLAHFRSMDGPRRGAMRLKYYGYQLLTNLFCHRIVGVSSASRNGRLILRPWQTLFNGLSAPSDAELRAMPVPAHYSMDRVRIVVLGRIERSKNVDRAVRVLAAFRKHEPTAQLHVVGPCIDVSKEELERVIRTAGVAGAVFLHGSVASPFPYLSHASVLLMTSEIEGLPGVVLEALACGTPVVSADLPGAVDIADRTQGIRCLPLSASNERWAGAIADALLLSRADIRGAFLQSPFTMDRYVDDMLRLWNVVR